MQANFYDGAIVGQREEQQDDRTNLILENGYRLYVLADGMGGHNAGNVASKLVCSAFRDFFSNLTTIDDREQTLKTALNHANVVMQEKLTEQNELVGMGTTVIALLLHEPTGEYSFISVGDSPLYKHSNGKLQRINANHAFFEDLKKLVEAGEMTLEEANAHPDRHAITSAVMGKSIEKYDVQSGQFGEGELIVLASDGIQTLSEEEDGEIASVINENDGDPELAVKGLLQAVEKKGLSHQDNTTVIIVRSESENSMSRQKPQEQSTPSTPETPATQVELPSSRDKSDSLKQEPQKKKGTSKLLLGIAVVAAAAIILWFISPEFKSAIEGLLNHAE
ncbi:MULTISPECIES: PP2C family serine/threonine-protein phosphatase [Gammaproteobacteria]|uniref:PP2C family protein-serine/threonine phosphatase n=1 Tax=Gammaproteobacteria TaxID=1236 RepID=UPI001401CD2B|nr:MULTISPECIES: protein phosphatase 2C domain-containing protein [Gammaproteobacteria]